MSRTLKDHPKYQKTDRVKKKTRTSRSQNKIYFYDKDDDA
jgi:hypothetical protein